MELASPARRLRAHRQYGYNRYCPFRIQIFRDSARQGKPIWSQDRVDFCPQVGRLATLQPGERITFVDTIRVRTAFGDSIPAGHYYVSAVFDARPKVVVPAGEVELGRPLR